MNSTLQQQMDEMGAKVRSASRALATIGTEVKNDALQSMAKSIRLESSKILTANEIDLKQAHDSKTPSSFVDRLKLDEGRVNSIAEGIEQIATLPDPVGQILASDTRPNQLRIEKIAIPIGVIGVIFESRPNVTADAAALCLKSGNGAVLRGGSAAQNSNIAIFDAMVRGLNEVGFDSATIQLIPSTDRDAVGMMLSGLNDGIDVIVPRGGKSLVARVQAESRVPVFAHLEGICHTYVHADADPQMATQILLNAKMRRTGICGATETILFDSQFDRKHLRNVLEKLTDTGCEIRADAEVRSIFTGAVPATPEDWSTEYLDAIVSVKSVRDIEDAIAHIEEFGTNHTEAIITDNQQIADRFLNEVGSAIVMHNTSTQFADGGEFGMGAEIGIATGKLHARGPVGVQQLTTFKYVVRGQGQVRP